MRRETKKAFQQLDDSRRGKAIPTELLKLFHPENPSDHPKHTLGYFADQLRIPAEILIKQFSSAGIAGLTPQHRVTEIHKSKLLDYLRAQHSYIKSIYANSKAIEEQLIVVQDITTELLFQLGRQPKLIYQLEPRRFEELVARLLEDQGCEVTLTKRTRDGGYDIIGKLKGSIVSPVFLAECKRYAPHNKVGVEVIRGLYAVTEIQRANLGLVITSSSFTSDAVEEKVRIGNRIELKEFNDLCTWLAPYRS